MYWWYSLLPYKRGGREMVVTEIVTSNSVIVTNDEAIIQYYREQGAQLTWINCGV